MKQLLKATAEKILQKAYLMAIPRRLTTSLSDDQAYPQVCQGASNDYRLFNQFRRNPVYNRILEHAKESMGHEYLRRINELDPELYRELDRFKPNDAYGNPRMFDYPTGRFSPTTLRYVKVLADLRTLFGRLDGLRICEIGVGYGGQCRVIDAFLRPASYCLVDIKPALNLAQRYLDNYVIGSPLTYRTLNELEAAPYDLVISNYAFTELTRQVQDAYLERVILRSSRGYITYNQITPPLFRSYLAPELIAMIPGAEQFEENPRRRPVNCVIAWGMTGRLP
jgi:hypothetical protein